MIINLSNDISLNGKILNKIKTTTKIQTYHQIYCENVYAHNC